MFQLPNIQKLRHNTIKKLEREKKEQKDLQKSNKQKINYKNMININRIKKPNSFKQVKEQYYNFELLEKPGNWFSLKFEVIYFYNVYGYGQIKEGDMATVVRIF